MYCEMQARENTAEDLTHFELLQHMYPGQCGYKVGGAGGWWAEQVVGGQWVGQVQECHYNNVVTALPVYICTMLALNSLKLEGD